jgi:aminoglycoside phosphotransferase (APT) family kinase protein
VAQSQPVRTLVRDAWGLVAPVVDMDLDALSVLVQPVFPGQKVVAATATSGGLANANLKLTLSAHTSPIRLRVYVRDAGSAQTEVNVMARVAGTVPVASILHFAKDNPFTGQPYALLTWVAGERLETVIQSVTEPDLNGLGRVVGVALAGIHGIPFPVTGFLGADLTVATPVGIGRDGLLAYLQACLVDGRGAARLGLALTQDVMRFAADAGAGLDAGARPPCLVHADFGGSNILVGQVDAIWTVAAILDWEFAFSGSPFVDFGNLLRPPLGQSAAFESGLLAGYRAAGGTLPVDWKRQSLLLDWFAWAEFLNRPDPGERLIADACGVLRSTMAAWPELPDASR